VARALSRVGQPLKPCVVFAGIVGSMDSAQARAAVTSMLQGPVRRGPMPSAWRVGPTDRSDNRASYRLARIGRLACASSPGTLGKEAFRDGLPNSSVRASAAAREEPADSRFARAWCVRSAQIVLT
jgi:hypothetical protein